jgi:hypothetical protein
VPEHLSPAASARTQNSSRVLLAQPAFIRVDVLDIGFESYLGSVVPDTKLHR